MIFYLVVFISGFLGALTGSLISAGILLRKLDGLMNPMQGEAESFVNEFVEGFTEQGDEL